MLFPRRKGGELISYRKAGGLISYTFLAVLLVASSAWAYRGDGVVEPGETSEDELRKAAQNPMADRISFPIQNNTNFGYGPLDKTQNITNIQPVIPPGQRAFYYVRVLEIPTPRWTTYDAAFFGVELPKDVPPTQQERAYTSPVWYTP